MKHKLKMKVTRPYTALLENGQSYTGYFDSLRPSRKWAKQLAEVTGTGVVLVDFERRPVMVCQRDEVKQALYDSKNAYKSRGLYTVGIVTGGGFKRR